MHPLHTTTHPTPVGPLTLSATEYGLVSSKFTTQPGPTQPPQGSPAQTWLDQARQELDEYFDDCRRTFTIPTDPTRTNPFDRAVHEALTKIDHGSTTTCGRLTAELGLPRDTVRKVAAALSRNPLLIIVPCHRVVGADGSLVGYAGGMAVKRWLLDHEADQQQLALPLTG